MKLFLSCTLVMILSVFPICVRAEAESLWAVSAKHVVLQPGERISGFTLKLKAGTIKSIPRIPSMWRISVYNFQHKDPPWSTTMDAQAVVGVAYLEPAFFARDFVCVRKGAADIPFDAELKIVASKAEKTRLVIIPLKGLEVKEIAQERM